MSVIAFRRLHMTAQDPLDDGKIIGRHTTYRGTEYPFLTGRRVRIEAVLKNANAPASEPSEPRELTSERAIEAAGGVTTWDRARVTFFVAELRAFRPVAMHPRMEDLECYGGKRR